MACDMRRVLSFILLTVGVLTSCSKGYELEIPIALGREQMRFPSGGNTFYVMVYSQGHWSVELDAEALWRDFSGTEGEGNSQLLVTAAPNENISRGVTITISNAHGSREMYISQESGLDEEANYSFVQEEIELSSDPADGYVAEAGTNLSPEVVAQAAVELIWETGGENWIRDVYVFPDKVIFSADANVSGAPRSATVKLIFPAAKWDTPLTSFFKVNQNL